MRLLKRSELYNGILVQCHYGNSTNDKPSETLYKIIIEEDDNGTHYYYSAVYLDMENQDCGWRMDSSLVIDYWYETDLTKKLNRSSKIEQILS